MSNDAALVSKSWHVLTSDRDTVYVKCHFEEKSYCLLVTDLKQVWAEEADVSVLKTKAREYDLALETDEQIATLVSQLKGYLNDLRQCTFKRVQDRIDLDYTESRGFAAFSWTFRCNPVTDASVILYRHVFGPMLAVIQSSRHPMRFEDGSTLKDNIEKMILKEKRIPPLGKDWLDRIVIAARVLENPEEHTVVTSEKRERPLSRSVSPPASSVKKEKASGPTLELSDTAEDQMQPLRKDAKREHKRRREV